MSMARRFVKQLEERGLRVELGSAPGELILKGDGEKTPKILEACRKFKPELLELFQQPGELKASPMTPASEPEANVCRVCRSIVFGAESSEAFCQGKPNCPYRRSVDGSSNTPR